MSSRAPSKKNEDARRAAFVQQYIKDRHDKLADKAEKKSNNVTTNYLAYKEFSYEGWEKISESFQKRKFNSFYKGKKAKKVQRKVNLILSDLHYGADLDPRLVPDKYKEIEESRRTAGVCAQVADYKRDHRAETELDIHLIGDIIQGKLHDVQNAAALTAQHARAMHCLIGAIEFLAKEYSKVTVRTSVGNHGRDVARHPDRALQDKYDSNEFRIYDSLKSAFRNHPGVVFDVKIRPFYIYDQFGHKGYMSHGDTHIKPGFPNKAIDVEKLRRQINEFRISDEEHLKVKLFGFGHVHVAMDVDISGATIVTNGCLIPTDEYAQSIGIFNTPCRQQLWETTPGHMFGDHRKLEITTDHDKDASLDKIIPPWPGFE